MDYKIIPVGRAKDIRGQKFGRLTVLERVENQEPKRTSWLCECDCGNKVIARADSLTGGGTQSCGCFQRETASINGKNRLKNIKGRTFGKLKALRAVDRRDKARHSYWLCECKCGQLCVVASSHLLTGNTKSCGRCPKERLVGRRFGMLTVVSFSHVDKHRRCIWKCRCDCGSLSLRATGELNQGVAVDCGEHYFEDLSNQIFGRLTVIQNSRNRIGYGVYAYKCRCECGNVVNVRSSDLISGNTQSCGCLLNEWAKEHIKTLRYYGKNHPQYNPGLTDEERIKQRYQLYGKNQTGWRARVFENNNYTCQICGVRGGKLNAHHLNSWDSFPEERFDIDNGITLCEDCHKTFHSEYGYGNNTKEQFWKFVNEYKEALTG